MSTLITNKIINPTDGNVIYKSPQAVVQVVTARTDTITAIGSGSAFTEISQLRLTIAPKFADSRLIIKFQIYGEFNDHNAVWRIYRDGAVISTAGEQGYNNQSGTSNWSSYYSNFFDQDQDSTANKYALIYSQIAGSTASRYYSIFFYGSDGGNRTFNLNRTLNSPNQTNREIGISTGQIIEVAQ